MAEGARLESVYTATYRGFESLSHRHIKRTALVAVFCYLSFSSYNHSRNTCARNTNITGMLTCRGDVLCGFHIWLLSLIGSGLSNGFASRH